MSETPQVTPRQRQILTRIVESYIASGEPVGSATVSRDFGDASPALRTLSPATVRSEMVSLAEAGLLQQPHTSAGRVPSASALRLYVDDLRRAGSTAHSGRLPARSHEEIAEQIEPSYAGVAGAHALLERTSRVLATLSSGVGMVLSAAPAGDLLEHVHFSRLAQRRVLAVLVTRGGTVRDRVLSLPQDRTSSELEAAGNFLNDNFRGWSLEPIRAELARRLEHERNEYQRLVAADELWSRAVPTDTPPSLFVDGVANLVTEREDRGRLRDVLAAVEAKSRIIELLNAFADAGQGTVRVIFDLESQAPEMAGLVLIAAPARIGGQPVGTLGVLGPQRMHYKDTLNAVTYIAGLLERLAQPGQP